jgi:hypothetical protein
MGTTYTRQESASITDGSVIEATVTLIMNLIR